MKFLNYVKNVETHLTAFKQFQNTSSNCCMYVTDIFIVEM